MHPRHSIRTYVAFLVLVAAVAAVLFVLVAAVGAFLVNRPVSQPLRAQQTRTLPQTPFTPEHSTQALQDKPFALLVSYTDQGFVPAVATISTGSTIRFFNASSRPLLLSIPGAPTLQAGDFWQYTFAQAGTTSFSDGAQQSATITVK